MDSVKPRLLGYRQLVRNRGCKDVVRPPYEIVDLVQVLLLNILPLCWHRGQDATLRYGQLCGFHDGSYEVQTLLRKLQEPFVLVHWQPPVHRIDRYRGER